MTAMTIPGIPGIPAVPGYGQSNQRPSTPQQPTFSIAKSTPVLASSELLRIGAGLLRLNFENAGVGAIEGKVSVVLDPTRIAVINGPVHEWQMTPTELAPAITVWMSMAAAAPMSLRLPMTMDAFVVVLREHGFA